MNMLCDTLPNNVKEESYAGYAYEGDQSLDGPDSQWELLKYARVEIYESQKTKTDRLHVDTTKRASKARVAQACKTVCLWIGRRAADTNQDPRDCSGKRRPRKAKAKSDLAVTHAVDTMAGSPGWWACSACGSFPGKFYGIYCAFAGNWFFFCDYALNC